jgi:hypothetical protein
MVISAKNDHLSQFKSDVTTSVLFHEKKQLKIEARKNGNSGKIQTAKDDRFVKTESAVVDWIRWARGILLPTQDARLRQPCWIHFVSGEQLYVMSMCATQLLTVSARLAHAELGFREVLKFFVYHVFHRVNHFHQFHLNQIQD